MNQSELQKAAQMMRKIAERFDREDCNIPYGIAYEIARAEEKENLPIEAEAVVARAYYMFATFGQNRIRTRYCIGNEEHTREHDLLRATICGFMAAMIEDENFTV